MPCWLISIVCNVGNIPCTKFRDLAFMQLQYWNCSLALHTQSFVVKSSWMTAQSSRLLQNLGGKILFALEMSTALHKKLWMLFHPHVPVSAESILKYECSKHLNLLSKCRKLSSTLMVYILCVKCKYLTASTALY